MKLPSPDLQPMLQDNLNFMAEYIRLWAALCRGGNSIVIPSATDSQSGPGLNKVYCIRLLEYPEIPPILKSAVLTYFQAVFVDLPEFTRISVTPYRCFPQQKLNSLNLSDRIYFMMQNKDMKAALSEKEDAKPKLSEVNDIHNLSLRLLKEVFCDLPDKLVFPNQPLEQSQRDSPNPASLDTFIKSLDSSKKEVSELLSLQASFFIFLKEQVDLGIADHRLIKSGLEAAGIVIKSEIHLDQEVAFEEASLLIILYYCSQRKEMSSKYFLLIENALNLFEVVGKCRLHYQVCAFLKLISTSVDDKPKATVKRVNEELINKLLRIYPLSSSDADNKSKKLRFGNLRKHITKLINGKSLSFQARNESKKDGSEEFIAPVDDKDASEVKQDDQDNRAVEDWEVVLSFLGEQRVPIDMILAESVFSEKDRTRQNHTALIRSGSINLKEGLESLQNSFLKREIEIKTIRLIVAYFHQRVTLGNYLADIELYHGEEEEQIFRDLSSKPVRRMVGNNEESSKPGATEEKSKTEPIEPEDHSAPYLIKLTAEMLNLDFERKNIGFGLIQSTLVENLVGFFRQVNSKLSSQLNFSKQLFRKTQNLMRNLDYHSRTISLLDPHMTFNNKLEFFQTCMHFLKLFSLYNPQNQLLLAQKLNHFLALTAIGLDVSELTSAILQSPKAQVHALRFINEVFNNLRRTLNSGHGGSYLYLQKTLNRIDREDPSLKEQEQLIARDLQRVALYIKILSGIILDEIGRPRSEVQIRILDSIINSPDITRIYEPVFYSQAIKLIQLRNTGDPRTTPKEDIDFYHFYSACLSLIGELSRVKKEGIRIANRISDLPFLREALISKNTPLLFKKQFMKWFHFFRFELLTQTPVSRSDESFQEIKEEIIMCVNFIQEDLFPETLLKSNSFQKNPVFLVDSLEYWQYLGFTSDHEKQRYGLLYFLYAVLRAVARYGLIDADEKEVAEKKEICVQLKAIRVKLLGILKVLTTNEVLSRLGHKANELPQIKMMICECILKIPIGKIDLMKAESPFNQKRFKLDSADDQFLNLQQQADQYFDPMLTEDEEKDDVRMNEIDENILMRHSLTKLVNKTRYALICSRRTFDEAVNYLIFCTTGDRKVGLQELVRLNDVTILERAIECLCRGDLYSNDKLESAKIESQETDTSAFLNIMNKLEYEIQEYKIKEVGTISISPGVKVEDKGQAVSKSRTVDNTVACKFNTMCEEATASFIEGYLTSEGLDEEIVPWVQIIRDKISLFDQEQEIVQFFQNLLISFLSTENTQFLMRTFSCFLSKSKPQCDPHESAKNHLENKRAKAFVWLQNLLCKSEVPALCLAHINRDSDPRLVGKCCSVLSLLLMNGNFKVQKTVHDLLQENIFTKSCFEYIRERLLQPYDRESGDILNHAGQEGFSSLQEPQPNSAKHAPLVDILLMLKYFCDNCYIDFQVLSIHSRTF